MAERKARTSSASERQALKKLSQSVDQIARQAERLAATLQRLERTATLQRTAARQRPRRQRKA